MKQLILLLVIILASCGARKSSVTKTETEIQQTSQEQTKSEVATEATKTDTSVIEEQEYVLEPVNNDKPIEVVKPDGSRIIVHNARIQSKNKKEQVNIKEAIKENVKQETQKSAEVKQKEVVKKKDTDRKQYNWFTPGNIIGVLFIIGLVWFIIWLRKKKQVVT